MQLRLNEVNTPATSETTQLTYNIDYNEGYNAGYLASRTVPPTVKVLDALEDDKAWYKRENSAQAILRIIFIGAFTFMFAAFLITITVLGVISLVIQSGMQWYAALSPLALAIVIGYYIRGKRSNE